MITEEARQTTWWEELQRRKKYLREIVDASARYERLLSQKDFQDVLMDMKRLSDIHGQQIDGWMKEKLNSDSPFKRMRLESVILKHQIRKEQIDEAMSYPQHIVQEANQAREELTRIKEEENKYGRNGNN